MARHELALKLFDTFSPRYLVPNGVTCLSMVCGFASIRASLAYGDPASLTNAAWLVMYAVLLDKVDGFVARRLKATSLIGVQLDSFSDFVTFGLAPAALFSRALPALAPSHLASGPAAMVVLAVCAAYGLSAALRLAKFNITTAVDDPRFFRGLPSTSSGGILAAAYLAHRELSLGEGAAIGLLAWMVVNAVLMVSNLPQPKVGSTRSAPAKYLQLAIFLCAYTMIPLRRFPVFILFVATAVSLGGFVFGVLVKRREGDSGGDPTPGAPALSK